MINDRILCISDMHIPYHHRDTFTFLTAIKKKYKPTRVVCSGDEVDCFPGTAEVLTEAGWKRFDRLEKGVKVAQWECGDVTFVVPQAYVDKPYEGDLLRIEHSSYLSETTPKHNVVKIDPITGESHRREAWDTQGTMSWHIPRAGKYMGGAGILYSNAFIRLQVAFQADGTFDKGAVKWEFSKERKITRLEEILGNCGIEFNKRSTARGTTILYVKKDNVPGLLRKHFCSYWVGGLSGEQSKVLLDELVHWDGTPNGVGFRYSCGVSENLDFVQSLATLQGLYTNMGDHYIDVHLERQEKTSQKSATFTNIPYSGRVYCVQVPSGMILVRQEGKVVVTGNCHAMSFHDSDPDLPSAGDELKRAITALQPLYKLFPKMDLIDSNHGSMVYRKGKHHGIPRKYLRDYGDILEAPSGWNWHSDLTIKLPRGPSVYFHHGLSKQGIKVVRERGLCVVQGHFHTEFSVVYAGTPAQLLWSMQIGCSIDTKALAFAYDNNNLGRPIIGHGIIIDGLPKLLPMVMKKNGRWNGVVP